MLRILGRTAPPLVLALLLTALASSAGAAGSGSLTGRVVDEWGHPVNRATVIATNGAGFRKTTTTGRDGRFAFTVGSGAPVSLRLHDGAYGEFHDTGAGRYAISSGSTTHAGDVVAHFAGHPGRAQGSIDTTSKSAVASAYRRQLEALDVSEKTYLPEPGHPCSVSRDPAYAKQRARQIKAVNFMRRLEGLSPVVEDTTLSRKAAAAALIEYHLGTLTHTPLRSALCWTKTGGAAAGRSNLSMGYLGTRAILGYLAEPGLGNVEVGHRSWILDPWQVEMGTGNVGLFNALYVVGSKADHTQAAPRHLTWPTPGWFPLELEPSQRWSWSTPRERDTRVDQAHVRVTKDGQAVALARTTRSSVDYGYLKTVTWDLAHAPAAGTYHVTISGIVQRGVTLAPIHYAVRLFSAR